MTLGQLIRKLRQGVSPSLSMAAVADHIGVSNGSVYWWESDERRPSPEHLHALLDLYKATDDERLRAWALRAGDADSAHPEP